MVDSLSESTRTVFVTDPDWVADVKRSVPAVEEAIGDALDADVAVHISWTGFRAGEDLDAVESFATLSSLLGGVRECFTALAEIRGAPEAIAEAIESVHIHNIPRADRADVPARFGRLVRLAVGSSVYVTVMSGKLVLHAALSGVDMRAVRSGSTKDALLRVVGSTLSTRASGGSEVSSDTRGDGSRRRRGGSDGDRGSDDRNGRGSRGGRDRERERDRDDRDREHDHERDRDRKHKHEREREHDRKHKHTRNRDQHHDRDDDHLENPSPSSRRRGAKAPSSPSSVMSGASASTDATAAAAAYAARYSFGELMYFVGVETKVFSPLFVTGSRRVEDRALVDGETALAELVQSKVGDKVTVTIDWRSLCCADDPVAVFQNLYRGGGATDPDVDRQQLLPQAPSSSRRRLPSSSSATSGPSSRGAPLSVPMWRTVGKALSRLCEDAASRAKIQRGLRTVVLGHSATRVCTLSGSSLTVMGDLRRRTSVFAPSDIEAVVEDALGLVSLVRITDQLQKSIIPAAEEQVRDATGFAVALQVDFKSFHTPRRLGGVGPIEGVVAPSRDGEPGGAVFPRLRGAIIEGYNRGVEALGSTNNNNNSNNNNITKNNNRHHNMRGGGGGGGGTISSAPPPMINSSSASALLLPTQLFPIDNIVLRFRDARFGCETASYVALSRTLTVHSAVGDKDRFAGIDPVLPLLRDVATLSSFGDVYETAQSAAATAEKLRIISQIPTDVPAGMPPGPDCLPLTHLRAALAAAACHRPDTATEASVIHKCTEVIGSGEEVVVKVWPVFLALQGGTERERALVLTDRSIRFMPSRLRGGQVTIEPSADRAGKEVFALAEIEAVALGPMAKAGCFSERYEGPSDDLKYAVRISVRGSTESVSLRPIQSADPVVARARVARTIAEEIAWAIFIDARINGHALDRPREEAFLPLRLGFSEKFRAGRRNKRASPSLTGAEKDMR
jgi:hypothetical protein